MRRAESVTDQTVNKIDGAGQPGRIEVEGEVSTVPPQIVEKVNKVMNGMYEAEVVVDVLKIINRIERDMFHSANDSYRTSRECLNNELSKSEHDLIQEDVYFGDMRFFTGKMTALQDLMTAVTDTLCKKYNISYKDLEGKL